MTKDPEISLDELLQDYNRLVAYIDEHHGEVTPEVEQAMDRLELDMVNKADKYMYVIHKLTADSLYYENLANQFYTRASRYHKTTQYLRDKIHQYLMNTNQAAVIGSMFSMSRKKSPPKVVISNEDIIPVEFKETETVTYVKKQALRDYLKANPDKPTPGASLEVGEYLILTIRKGK